MKKLLTVMLLVMVAVFSVSAQTWTSAQTLTLDGASLSSDVTDVPIAVRINSTNCPDFDGGEDDLRFVSSDGSTLPLEIEEWNASGTSTVWVLVPSIAASGATTIEMCWGASGVSSISDGESVFTTDNGYAGVWHLGETSTGPVYDATENGIDVTNSEEIENVTQGVEGCFGPAAEFAGDGFISIADEPALYSDEDMTAEIWLKNDGGGGVFYKRGISSPIWEVWGWEASTRGAMEYIYSTADEEQGWYDGSNTAGSDFAHFALVREGGNLFAYEAGSKATLASGLTEATYDGWGIVVIGAQDDNAIFFNGILDEARISTVARSEDFMAVSHANGEASLITYGSTGTPTNQPSASGPGIANGITAAGEAGKMALVSTPNPFHKSTSVTYRVPKAENVKLGVYDMQGKLVKNLVNARQVGQNNVKWDGTNSRNQLVADGMYLFRLSAGNQMMTKRIVLMK